jgi:hypothetical protein
MGGLTPTLIQVFDSLELLAHRQAAEEATVHYAAAQMWLIFPTTQHD